jgi:hypothetical protein
MAKEPEWFKRLADVPGAGYRAPAGVRKVAGHDAEPTFTRYELNGETIIATTWRVGNVDGSASPAQLHGLGDTKARRPSDITLRLFETLELPGTATDYHFAIQQCSSFLWSQRHEEPSVLETIIDLDLLDIRLIEARPSAITDEFMKGPQTYYAVEAFSRLVGIYKREGMLGDALDVAVRASRFQQSIEIGDVNESRQAWQNEQS